MEKAWNCLAKKVLKFFETYPGSRIICMAVVNNTFQVVGDSNLQRVFCEDDRSRLMEMYRDAMFMGEEEEEIKEHVLSTVGESLRKESAKMDVIEMRAILSQACGPINCTSSRTKRRHWYSNVANAPEWWTDTDVPWVSLNHPKKGERRLSRRDLEILIKSLQDHLGILEPASKKQRSCPPDPEDAGCPPEREDAGCPPEREDAGCPPEREDAGCPPEREDAGCPPEREDAGCPPEREDAGCPPEREDAGCPPESEDAGCPIDREDAGCPPECEDAGCPPEREDAGCPPEREDAGCPPEREDAGCPPEREDAGCPPEREDAGCPPEREDAGCPPECEDAGCPLDPEDAGCPPESEDAGCPIDREDAGCPPEREDAGCPPEHEDAGCPPEREDAGCPIDREDAGCPPEREDAGCPPEREDAGCPPEREDAGSQVPHSDATPLQEDPDIASSPQCENPADAENVDNILRYLDTLWRKRTIPTKENFLISLCEGVKLNAAAFHTLKDKVSDEILDACMMTMLRNEKSDFEYMNCALFSMVMSAHLHDGTVDCEISSQYLLGFFNLGRCHWVLIVIDCRSSTIYVLDPLGETSKLLKSVLGNWRNYLKSSKYNTSLAESPWAVQTLPHVKQQDSNSCGIFCLMFAEKMLHGNDLVFPCNNAVVASFRRKVVSLIIQNQDLTVLMGLCRICRQSQRHRERQEEINWVGCDECGQFWCHFLCLKAHFKISEDFNQFSQRKWKCCVCSV
uniref:Uncharacterized protein LOC111100026 isoform X5 n=1 Tax=Crassostrea virginica TaxID=6565 RepID=A0A8B8A767_CRAVI|nr:uncharacterized protein LOC111100026 isoform X5 [Crassostrea virginica]